MPPTASRSDREARSAAMESFLDARSKLTKATAIVVVFMVAEVVGGIVSGSLAILTDAAHLMSDLVGFVVSLVALHLAKRKPTAVLSFGFKRAEVLGALLSVSIIWVLTGFLLIEAFSRARRILFPLKGDEPVEPIKGDVMFLVACLGLLCNLVMLAVLGGHGHSHALGGGHGHAHGRSQSHGGSGSSKNKTGFFATAAGAISATASSAFAPSSSSSSSATAAAGKRHGHSHSGSGGGHGHSHDGGEHGDDHHDSHSDAHDDDDEDEDNEDEEAPVTRRTSVDLNGLSITYGAVVNATSPGRKRNDGVDASPVAATTDVAATATANERQSLLPSSTATRHGSSGDHGHSHSHSHADQEDLVNINVSAAYVHALGDVLQSVGVIVAGAIIWAFPGQTWAEMCDPAATFLFSILVLYSTNEILRSSVRVLMEGVPDGLDVSQLTRDLHAVEGVQEAHDLHVWSLSTDEAFLSVHIVVDEAHLREQDLVLSRARKMLADKYKITHATIQVETDASFMPASCDHPHGLEDFGEDL